MFRFELDSVSKEIVRDYAPGIGVELASDYCIIVAHGYNVAEGYLEECWSKTWRVSQAGLGRFFAVPTSNQRRGQKTKYSTPKIIFW